MNQSELRGYKRGQRDAQKRCAASVPTNWLDPLLTGPKAVLRGGGEYNCHDIERLLRAVRQRIENPE